MLKYLFLGLLFLITACTSQNKADNQTDWFEVGGVKLYGKEGRLGFEPKGENSNISKGGHFFIYFWGKPEELADKYRLIGVHEETGTITTLYPDWEVSRSENKLGADAQSAAKFGFDKKGTWRLEVYMGDNYFDSIVVEAEPDLNKEDWKASPLFKSGIYTMIGEEERIGFIYDDGEVLRFYPNKKQRYMWHFWGKAEELQGSFVVKGTSNETGESINVFNSSGRVGGPINGADASIVSSMSLPSTGLWRLDAYLGEKLFGSIVVEVHKKNE
ncbi:DUF4871 domain-containing protein [Cohnella lupini]|uniref:DUF4871 domain-containing protein n=1 Tax=Cohnella lupini TaxID=1294267 RepID=A0A3D9HNM8_9BACL|nr:DUF4871 domain-containing protein [Cohnella lupini]RED51107.1 hypothetical protein DFP95_1505 [Cohnella lupini]